jgi:hypothetical protein
MKGSALRILREVEKFGEVSLAAAIRLRQPHHRSHLDQYPLALLLEGGYLGMTINHSPPAGADAMREFSLATTLHMFSLPKNERGEVHYLGIISTGSIDPEKERVFLKAKGALYLDEWRQKWWDRLWFFVLGFGLGVLAPIASAWVRGHLRLP